MYSIVKKALFSLPAEASHELSLDWLGAAQRLGVLSSLYQRQSKPVRVMGLHFPNPVGLAAGLDKNGDYFNALGQLGFGFIEIGTVTPVAQAGNPQPRLFRLPEHNAIINRMGFNNLGIDHLVEKVKKRKFDGVLGINIGKNKLTPEDDALSDYLICLRKAYQYADYITVNISSPNTPGLRKLQFGKALDSLLLGIKQEQQKLHVEHGKYVPIAVKIAPDMNEDELFSLTQQFLNNEIDAVVATNTTIARDAVKGAKFAEEAGGLSGAPVRNASTAVIHQLNEYLDGKIPIIGVGGICSAKDAQDKIDAGASLVQVYSGFIYEGPSLIKECVKQIKLKD